MTIAISTLKEYCNGEINTDTEIHGLQVDSRKINTGDLYVCLIGERVDGHEFASEALKKGASALLVDRWLDIDAPQIKVDNTLEGLLAITKGYYESLDLFTIAITGSNGKTSTKDMFQSILQNIAPTISTYSNQNTLIGTCLNIFRCTKETKYLILEYGLDLPGEVKEMAAFINPDAAIVTSVGAMHMLSFDSVEEVAREKLEIFNFTKNKDLRFYQGDFPELDTLGAKSFGFKAPKDYLVTDTQQFNDKTSFKVNDKSFSTNLLGIHQASNAAGVIGLLQSIDIPNQVIQKGLMEVSLSGLRTEIIEKNKASIIMDAYKSNPASAKFALDLLHDFEYEGNKIAILGDMRELGMDELQLHIELLEYLNTLDIDVLYTLGENFEYALNQITIDKMKVYPYNKIEDLKEDIQSLWNEENLILIKGSRSLAMEKLLDEGK